jgi:signal transduction histidine kinase
MFFLVLSSIVTYQNVRNVLANQDLVNHTYEAISLIEEAYGSLIQAESKHYGYMLAGNQGYLQDYKARVQDSRQKLQELIDFVEDNPAQLVNARVLSKLTEERVQEMEELNRRRSDRVPGNGRRRMMQDIDRVRMAKLRGQVDLMKSTEQRLLAIRNTQSSISAGIATANIWLLLIMGVILAALLLAYSVRYRALDELARQREADYLDELEHRVKERTAELNSTNAELEAFSYSVSHDLRAPLRAMSGYASMLEEDLPPPLADDTVLAIDRIKAAAARMSRLIDDLLRLSRIARAEMEPDRVDLTALASKTLEDLQAANPQRKAKVSVQRNLNVVGDAHLLGILMENLLHNAWKYSGRKDVVEIRVGERDGAIFVRDKGAGFDVQYLERAFEPFQRLHSESQFEGAGIGLAICKRIVSRHGGRIWAESTPDVETTFWFRLGDDEDS